MPNPSEVLAWREYWLNGGEPMSRAKEIEDRRLAVVAERLAAVARKWTWNDGIWRASLVPGYAVCKWKDFEVTVSAEELRDLANAIDGAEEAVRAMITDLQEESTAYQRGVQAGIQQMLTSVKEYYARRPDQGMWTNVVEVLCALENHAQSK